jgi:molybdate transport system permease protein
MLTAVELEAVILSLQVATAATLFALPFAIAAGWYLSRNSSRGKILLDSLVSAPLVMPPLVTGYLLLLLLGPKGPLGAWLLSTFGIRIAFTWVGAAIASAVLAFPLMVKAIQIRFESIDPELEGMARTLGANRRDAFFSISLPLALPGVLTAILLGFARSLGEFGATIVLAGNLPGRTQTIPLAIYSAINRPDGDLKVISLLLISVLLGLGAIVASNLLIRASKKASEISDA